MQPTKFHPLSLPRLENEAQFNQIFKQLSNGRLIVQEPAFYQANVFRSIYEKAREFLFGLLDRTKQEYVSYQLINFFTEGAKNNYIKPEHLERLEELSKSYGFVLKKKNRLQKLAESIRNSLDGKEGPNKPIERHLVKYYNLYRALIVPQSIFGRIIRMLCPCVHRDIPDPYFLPVKELPQQIVVKPIVLPEDVTPVLPPVLAPVNTQPAQIPPSVAHPIDPTTTDVDAVVEPEPQPVVNEQTENPSILNKGTLLKVAAVAIPAIAIGAAAALYATSGTTSTSVTTRGTFETVTNYAASSLCNVLPQSFLPESMAQSCSHPVEGRDGQTPPPSDNNYSNETGTDFEPNSSMDGQLNQMVINVSNSGEFEKSEVPEQHKTTNSSSVLTGADSQQSSSVKDESPNHNTPSQKQKEENRSGEKTFPDVNAPQGEMNANGNSKIIKDLTGHDVNQGSEEPRVVNVEPPSYFSRAFLASVVGGISLGLIAPLFGRHAQTEIEQLEGEKQQIENEIERLGKERVRSERKMKKLTKNAKREEKNLRGQVVSLNQGLVELAGKKRLLEKDLKIVQEQKESIEKKLKLLDAQYKESQGKNALASLVFEEEKERLIAENKELLELLNGLQAKLDEQERDFQKVNAELKNTQEKLSALQEKMASVDSEGCKKMLQIHEMISSLEGYSHEVEGKNAELASLISTIEEFSIMREQIDKEIREKSNLLEDLKKQIESSNHAIKCLQELINVFEALASPDLNELEKELSVGEKTNEKIRELQNQLKEHNKSLGDFEELALSIIAKEYELSSVKQQKSELEEQIKDLQMQLQGCEKNGQEKRLEVESLQKKLSQLKEVEREKSEQLETFKEAENRLQDDFKERTALLANAKIQIENVNGLLNESKLSWKEAIECNEKLSGELVEKKKTILELQGKLKASKLQEAEYQKKYEELIAEKEKTEFLKRGLEEQLEKSEESLSVSEKTNESLLFQVEEANKKLEQLNKQIREEAEKLETARNVNQELSQRLIEHEKSLNEAQQQKEKLEQEMEALKKEFQDLKNSKNALQEHLVKANGEKDSLEKEIEKLRGGQSRSAEENAKTKVQIEDIKAKLAELEKELAEKQVEWEKLNKELAQTKKAEKEKSKQLQELQASEKLLLSEIGEKTKLLNASKIQMESCDKLLGECMQSWKKAIEYKEKLENKIKEKESTILELQGKLKASKSQEAECQKKYEELKSEESNSSIKLKKQNKKLQAKFNSMREDSLGMKEEWENKLKELETANKELSLEYDNKIISLQEEITQLTLKLSKLEELKHKLTEAEAERDGIFELNELLKKQLCEKSESVLEGSNKNLITEDSESSPSSSVEENEKEKEVRKQKLQQTRRQSAYDLFPYLRNVSNSGNDEVSSFTTDSNQLVSDEILKKLKSELQETHLRINELEKKNSELQEEVNILLQPLKDEESDFSTSKEVQFFKLYNETNTKLEEAEKELEGLKRSKEALKNALEKKIEDNKKEIDDLKESEEVSRKEHEKKLEDTRRENTQLKNAKRRLEDEIERKEEKYKKEIEDSKFAADEKIRKAREKKDKKIKKLKATLAEKSKEVEDYAKKALSKIEDNAKASKAEEKLKQQIEDLTKTREEMDQTIAILNLQNQKLIEENTNFKRRDGVFHTGIDSPIDPIQPETNNEQVPSMLLEYSVSKLNEILREFFSETKIEGTSLEDYLIQNQQNLKEEFQFNDADWSTKVEEQKELAYRQKVIGIHNLGSEFYKFLAKKNPQVQFTNVSKSSSSPSPSGKVNNESATPSLLTSRNSGEGEKNSSDGKEKEAKRGEPKVRRELTYPNISNN